MNARGHSLLEALLGLALAVGIAAALAIFVAFQQRRLAAETHRAAALEELQAALDLLAADLRAAGRSAVAGSGWAGSPVGFCRKETEGLRWVADLDGDGSLLGPGEDVAYCWCPGTGGSPLYRAWRASAAGEFVVEPLLSSVSALSFRYGARSVEVEIRIAEETPLGRIAEGARTTVTVRNSAQSVPCEPGPACPREGCG